MAKLDDTKSKIIDVARQLFAMRGFDGTSIREIASAADVNVAAVNYHFINKQNLFWYIFQASMDELEREIDSLQKDGVLPPTELVLKIFGLLNTKWVEVRNTFRMMMSSQLPEIDTQDAEFCHGRKGPPGSLAIKLSLQQELGEDVPEEALMWGVRTIFSHMIHMSLMVKTEYVKKFSTADIAHIKDTDLVARGIVEHVRAIVSHLRNQADHVNEVMTKP